MLVQLIARAGLTVRETLRQKGTPYKEHGLDDPSLEVGMIRAYHRHMADFCADYSNRLKSMIVASARNPDEAVREIREWGN